VGDAMVGAIGSSRYPFTVDTPRNREFVKRFHDLHGMYPDMFDGETYEGLEWLGQVITKAGTDDVEKVIDAWEDSSYEGLEGPFFMRKCDHQAVQLGFAAEAVKDPKYPHRLRDPGGGLNGDDPTRELARALDALAVDTHPSRATLSPSPRVRVRSITRGRPP